MSIDRPATVLADVRGTRTAYALSGRGKPLLLIHGAEGSHRSFDNLVPYLVNDFTVVRHDQRDCGETINDAMPASLRTLADDAVALLHSIGIGKAAIFGTSFGGRVAQAIALFHPEVVEHLILASTWSLADSLATLNGEVVAAAAALRALLPGSAEALAEYFYPKPFLDAHPEFKGHFRNAKPRDERSARRAQTIAGAAPVHPGRIAAPTLLVAGELDRLVPPALTLAIDAPNACSVVLPGVGHLSYVQAPAQLAPHIRRFLGVEVAA